MNKILNWTIGSVFRTLGRILAYLLVGSLIAIFVSKNDIKITDLLGIETIHAKSVTITSQTYSTRVYNRVQDTYSWASYTNNGTQQTWDTDSNYIKGFRTKFYSSNKFESGTTYTAKVRANTTPKGTYELFRPDEEFSCYGSVSNSNYNPQTSAIGVCQLVSIVIENDNNFTDYYINFTPTTNIETVQFVILWGASLPVSRINIDNSSTITYDTSTQDAINSQTNNLINNQNNNTNSIINNQQENTTNIINNQNENTQDLINNQNELLGTRCSNLIDFNNGNVYSITSTSNDYIKVTDYYVHLESGKTYYVNWKSNKPYQDSNSSDSVEIYLLKDKAYNNIIQIKGKQYTINPSVSGNYYVRLDCNKNGETCTYYDLMISEVNKPYCKYGTYSSKQDETTNSINNLNDSINDDDTSGATSEYSSLFNNFQDTDFGLTGIITAPLDMIRAMSSGVCSPITVGGGTGLLEGVSFSLPCLGPLYQQWFPSILQIYQMFTFGIIAYKICVDVLSWVRSFRKPDEDRVEVLDL